MIVAAAAAASQNTALPSFSVATVKHGISWGLQNFCSYDAHNVKGFGR
jgi:hypothetical protein